MCAKNLRDTGVTTTRSQVIGRAKRKTAASESTSTAAKFVEALQSSAWRRDFNLIREILLTAEQPGPHAFSYPEFGAEMVQNHLVLLVEAGLLRGTMLREGGGTTRALIERLTWAGHDLLALVRNSGDWQKARTKLLDPHGRADSDVLTEWLRAQVSA